MSKKVQQYRGLEKDLPVLEEGRIAFTTDTKKLFIGSNNGNIEITKEEEIEEIISKLSIANDNIKISKKRIMGGFVAHRGLCSVAPENTLKAISEAGRRGFSMVEIDPMKLSDGTWILMHDTTVDRTTNGTGNTASFNAVSIKKLIIDTPTHQIDEYEKFTVPTLDEALREIAYYGMGVNLDGSKFSAIQEDIDYLVSQLDKYNLTDKSVIICPNDTMREMVAKSSSKISIGWVSTVDNVDKDVSMSKLFKNNIIVGYISSDITSDVINKCHVANVSVYGYKADTYILATKLESFGVDFIETDYLLPIGRFKK